MTRIPSTIQELADRLDRLDGLVTAAQWQRAAIVFAFTERQQGKRTDLTSANTGGSSRAFGILNTKAFAALGISGLSSHTTVEKYRQAWQSAIDAGKAVPVSPGDPYREPAMEWPAAPAAAPISSKMTTPAENEKIIMRLLDDPATVERMFGDRRKRAIFAAGMGGYGGARMRTEPVMPRTPPEPSLDVMVKKAGNVIDGIFELVSRPGNIPADPAGLLRQVASLHNTLDIIACRLAGESVDTLTEKILTRS